VLLSVVYRTPAPGGPGALRAAGIVAESAAAAARAPASCSGKS